jgi:hypothetical protein
LRPTAETITAVGNGHPCVVPHLSEVSGRPLKGLRQNSRCQHHTRFIR